MRHLRGVEGILPMEPVRYYREEFGAELQKVCRASSSRCISIVSLLPDPIPGGGDGPLTRCAAAFCEVRSKPLFLFCYFFIALIDQAIHASLRQEHVHFDRLARYPKLVGILATACTNLHPAVLLLAATLYLDDSEVDEATVHFECLADFFIEDYHVFLDVKYPALTRGWLTPVNATRLCVGSSAN
jgi:hypothetical protein